MEQLSPEFVEEVTRRFMSCVRKVLEPEEIAFLDGVNPPAVDVAQLEGEPCIRVAFYGSETRLAWDGTEADAVDCVIGVVGAAAASISDGYWMSGGWTTRTSSPPP